MSSDKKFDINFIVVSPFPDYVSYIGGATVPHTLANELTKLGENVYLYANDTNPKYNVTCIPWGTGLDYDPANTVVILLGGAGDHINREYLPDNLKNAPNIVRWVVQHQERSYDPGDKVYVYHKYWDMFETQRVDGEMSVIEVDLELFKDRGEKRDGTCYFIKGHLDEEAERAVHKEQDYCIDSVFYNIPNDKKMEFLADLFNKKEYFITYTPMTFTSVLAAMCGCKSIIIPKSKYNREKWMNGIWCSKYGIAYGMDDLPRAVATMDQVVPNIKHYLEVTQPTQLKQFIQDCYNWLEEKYNI